MKLDAATTANLMVIARLWAVRRNVQARMWAARVPTIKRQLDEMRAVAR